MFTGIVQGVGTVRAIEPRGGDVTLVFDTAGVSLADIEPGGQEGGVAAHHHDHGHTDEQLRRRHRAWWQCRSERRLSHGDPF